MNKFIKQRKIAMAILLGITFMLSMAITVFAEAGTAEPSGLRDPMLYVFMAVVVGFFGVIAGAVFLYFKFKGHSKIKEIEDDDGTIKLYDDLEDHKWDVPESVFVEDIEPTPALLTDFVPAKAPVWGLNGFIITEGPIDPVQAVNMGAEPYAYVGDQKINNMVYEEVSNMPLTEEDLVYLPSSPSMEEEVTREGYVKLRQEANLYPSNRKIQSPAVHEETVNYSVLEDGKLISEPFKPFEFAHTPASSPFTYIGNSPFTSPAPSSESASAVVIEDGANTTLLEDTDFAVPNVVVNKRTQPALPLSNPRTYLAKEVPITIVTTGDDDGVVQINAAVFENKVTATELVDNPFEAPVPQFTPIMAAATPIATPLARNMVGENAEIIVPTEHAAVYEDAIAASALAPCIGGGIAR